MPDQETISRIAKILARAGSDNQNEAAAALEGAYKRMVRDRVTLRDLLSLPLGELYQDTLVKLVGVILADQPGLSLPAKRQAYSEYMRLIVARFSPSGENPSKESTGSANHGKSREEEAREYEERRAREERARGGAGEGGTSRQGGDSPFSRENTKTAKQERGYSWTIRNRTFSFSPAAFWQSIRPFFEHGSLFSYVVRDPIHGLRLFAASLIWGAAFALVALTLAALVHAATDTAPLVDVKFKNAFSFLTALGAVWKTRQLFKLGWFRA